MIPTIETYSYSSQNSPLTFLRRQHGIGFLPATGRHQGRVSGLETRWLDRVRAELSEISIRKLVDLASPLLAQTCACGKTIPKAKLEMTRRR